jgi:hypothetical protein
MSARYERRAVGVFDRELGVLVAPTDGAPWAEYHAWIAIPGNVLDQPPALPPPTLEYAVAEKLAAIEDKAAAQRAKVTMPSSPSEMASWTLKVSEAKAWGLSKDDADAPMLAIEGAARGTGTEDIVARVLANAQAYQQAEGMIAGASGKHRDAVKALATAEEVLAYDFSSGWPFVPPQP